MRRETKLHLLLLSTVAVIMIAVVFQQIQCGDFADRPQGVKQNGSTSETFTNVSSLGNKIAVYHWALIEAIVNKTDFQFDKASQEFENTMFLQKFPVFLEFHGILKDISENMRNAGVSSEVVAGTRSKPYLHECAQPYCGIIHNIMKPLFQKLLDSALQATGFDGNAITESLKDTIVIHFRCADVPFTKHPKYHLQKYEFFTVAVRNAQTRSEFKNVKIRRVVLLTFPHHENTDSRRVAACNTYTNSIKMLLEKHFTDLRIDIQSETTLEDFATLFYAPYTVSTGSSFSFYAGYYGMGFFQTTAISQVDSEQEVCPDCSNEEKSNCYLPTENVICGYNIMHSSVDDYTDTNAVMTLLN